MSQGTEVRGPDLTRDRGSAGSLTQNSPSHSKDTASIIRITEGIRGITIGLYGDPNGLSGIISIFKDFYVKQWKFKPFNLPNDGWIKKPSLKHKHDASRI